MRISHLYYSVAHRPFFILPRTAEAESVLVMKLLEHDASLYGGSDKLADKRPPRAAFVGATGRTVVASAAQVKDGGADVPEGSVAVIQMRGTMMKEGTLCSYGTEELAGLMVAAAMDGEVVGLVLDVDSGGGCVDAVAPMTQAIARCRAMGKPVVASCDLCASAAYYVACHCDSVMANNDISAEFGSIGVMTQLADYAGYYEQRGIKLHNIYSTLSEHKNAPFEAALKGDYKSIKEEELDPLARQFQSSVKAHRPGLDLKTEGVLSGRMFMYDEAQRVGLIDGIGTLDDAVSEVRRRAAEAHLERYLRG